MEYTPDEMTQSAGDCWYVRDHVAGQPRQVWKFNDQTAVLMGVSNPERGIGTYFQARSGETIWDCLRRETPWLDLAGTEGQFHRMKLGPGEFYPRMARPIALARETTSWSPSVLLENAYVAESRRQLKVLVRRLESICQTVQPTSENLHAYGHEIRNLLILAATEVEMHWRGILVANEFASKDFTTNTYANLIEPLKLPEYSVLFHDFPTLLAFGPFADWKKQKPTQTLSWYTAYNAVKHNREVEFNKGTLLHVFNAISACFSLLVAQFGPRALGAELSELATVKVPDWSICDMYLPQMERPTWTPVNHHALQS